MRPARLFLCRYRDRLPLDSDSFLWASGRDGVFKMLSPADQRLVGEQGRFVLSVAREQPAAVLASSLDTVRDQVVAWRLPAFNQTPADARQIAAHLPPEERRAFIASTALHCTMPPGWVAAVGRRPGNLRRLVDAARPLPDPDDLAAGARAV